MLFAKNPRKLLSEAAAADMLDPEVSSEVKEVIDSLEDTLTNNVEEVKDADKTTNGGVPVVSEAVSMMRAANSYNGARYLVSLEQVMAVMESEGEEAAAAEVPAGEAPTPEQVEEHEPHPANVIDDIAEKNGVEPEQVAVVISAESVNFLAHCAMMESKLGITGADALATRKLIKLEACAKSVKDKVVLAKAKKKTAEKAKK